MFWEAPSHTFIGDWRFYWVLEISSIFIDIRILKCLIINVISVFEIHGIDT